MTCVLVTDKGTIVAGSMKEGLPDARIAAAPRGGRAATNIFFMHAEENALYAAGVMSAKPMALGVAGAKICPNRCRPLIRSLGGTITSDYTAVW